MANFNPIYEITLKKEGGYQNSPADSANYCYSYINRKRTRGALIGTNRGISATALQVYLKRCPTVAEVKAITPQLAYIIFKQNFWDKISGDLIKNQSVAHIIFQMRIGSGNLIHCRKGINKLCIKLYKKSLMYEPGLNINIPTNWMYEFTPESVRVINSLPAQQLFDTLKAEHFAHFDRIIAADSGKQQFEKGWKKRLANLTFNTSDTDKIAGIGGFFL